MDSVRADIQIKPHPLLCAILDFLVHGKRFVFLIRAAGRIFIEEDHEVVDAGIFAAVKDDVVCAGTVEFADAEHRLDPVDRIMAFRIADDRLVAVIPPSKVVHPVQIAVFQNDMIIAHVALPSGVVRHHAASPDRRVQPDFCGRSLHIQKRLIKKTLQPVSNIHSHRGDLLDDSCNPLVWIVRCTARAGNLVSCFADILDEVDAVIVFSENGGSGTNRRGNGRGKRVTDCCIQTIGGKHGQRSGVEVGACRQAERDVGQPADDVAAGQRFMQQTDRFNGRLSRAGCRGN